MKIGAQGYKRGEKKNDDKRRMEAVRDFLFFFLHDWRHLVTPTLTISNLGNLNPRTISSFSLLVWRSLFSLYASYASGCIRRELTVHVHIHPSRSAFFFSLFLAFALFCLGLALVPPRRLLQKKKAHDIAFFFLIPHSSRGERDG